MWTRPWKWSTEWLVRALALTLIAACGSTAPNPPQAAVPWTDRPGTTEVTFASNAVASRPCHGRDLHVSVGNTGAYHGHQAQELTLRNVAADACLVSATMPIAVVLGTGQHSQAGRDSKTSMIGASNGMDGLAAGGSVHIIIGTPGTCPGAGTNPKIASVVQLTLTGGEVIAVTGTWINVECGPPVVLAFDLQQTAPAAVPASAIVAKLAAPSSAVAGQTLVYFVTVSNPTLRAISLSPCPSYTESIGAGAPFKQTFLLNCTAVGGIPGGGQVTFEMRLQLPTNTPKGRAKLSWHLEVPNGAYAGASVTVN
jgi:hypothetical protein